MLLAQIEVSHTSIRSVRYRDIVSTLGAYPAPSSDVRCPVPHMGKQGALNNSVMHVSPASCLTSQTPSVRVPMFASFLMARNAATAMTRWTSTTATVFGQRLGLLGRTTDPWFLTARCGKSITYPLASVGHNPMPLPSAWADECIIYLLVRFAVTAVCSKQSRQ